MQERLCMIEKKINIILKFVKSKQEVSIHVYV